MALLTQEEKVRVRSHLAYTNVTAVSTYVLGTPAALETQFIIEGAMDRLLPEALTLFRQYLSVCDKILQQKIDNLENLAVSELGEIKVRPDEQQQLDRQYDYWRGKLCDMMGIFPNPWEKAISGGGINVSVQH